MWGAALGGMQPNEAFTPTQRSNARESHNRDPVGMSDKVEYVNYEPGAITPTISSTYPNSCTTVMCYGDALELTFAS